MGSLIDTAVAHLTDNKYYFFRGSQYVRYDSGTDKIEPGYPKSIDNNWKDLWDRFPGPYDAACQKSGSTTQYYFFKGGQYVRYTNGVGVDVGYPKSISAEWNDLWDKFPGPYDAAVVGTANDKYYFSRAINMYVIQVAKV